MLHSFEDCTGVHIKRSIKDELGLPMVGRTDTVKQYQKSEENLIGS